MLQRVMAAHLAVCPVAYYEQCTMFVSVAATHLLPCMFCDSKPSRFAAKWLLTAKATDLHCLF